MKQAASYETIQSITWNPEGHQWVSVVDLSYQCHQKTGRHKFLMFTIGLVLMSYIYQPTPHDAHSTGHLVQVKVIPVVNQS